MDDITVIGKGTGDREQGNKETKGQRQFLKLQALSFNSKRPYTLYPTPYTPSSYIRLIALLGLTLALSLVAGRVQALPGQTPDEAVVWIQANSTLRPVRGERLLIRKSDTPARRFTFLASPLQVGRASPGATGGIIRTEEISFFDIQNGVSRDRLQESLRVIYGPTIYQDFAQARILYAYPTQATRDQSVNRDTPLLAALQGEVREGDRYAYWLEIVRGQNGVAQTGKITVFLKDDLSKLEATLRNRSGN